MSEIVVTNGGATPELRDHLGWAADDVWDDNHSRNRRREMTDYPALPRAFYPRGSRRSYASADRTKPGEHTLPAEPRPLEARCPPAILDSSPDGSGLGIWLLVEEGDGECVYEYGGGIA